MLGSLLAPGKKQAIFLDALEATAVYGITAFFLIQMMVVEEGTETFKKASYISGVSSTLFLGLSIPVAILYSSLPETTSPGVNLCGCEITTSQSA